MDLNFIRKAILLLTAIFCVLPLNIQASDENREAEIRKMYEDAAKKSGISQKNMPTIIFVNETNVLPGHTYHLDHEATNWVYGNTIWINKNYVKLSNSYQEIMIGGAIEQIQENTAQQNDSPVESSIRKIFEEAAQLHNIPQEAVPTLVFVDQHNIHPEDQKYLTTAHAWVNCNATTIYINKLMIQCFKHSINWKFIALHEMTHVKNHDALTRLALPESERHCRSKLQEHYADQRACELIACESCITEEANQSTDTEHPGGYMTKSDYLKTARSHAGKCCSLHGGPTSKAAACALVTPTIPVPLHQSVRESQVRQIYQNTAQELGITPVPEINFKYNTRTITWNDGKTVFVSTNYLNATDAAHQRAAHDEMIKIQLLNSSWLSTIGGYLQWLRGK